MFVMNLYRALNKKLFSFDFVVYDDYKTEYLEEVLRNGDKVFQFRQKHKNKLLNYLDQKRFVDNILKYEKYNIVHCNGNSLLGILRAALPAKKHNLHVITHSHNQGERHENIIGRVVSNYLKRKISTVAELGYTCSDKAGKSKYVEEFIHSSKYKVIDNGIDVKKYSFNSLIRKKIRAEFGISEETFLIGHVGRFEYPKNQSYLLDIFHEVIKLEPSAKLVLVGDGIQRHEFEEKIQKIGIWNNVILTGLRMDVNEIYSALDLFVLPSVHEGFPFVLVEAQMNGLRCIVTDNISKDVNISGQVKFISIENTPEVWANAIRYTRNRLDENEIQKVRDKYDIAIITRSVEKDYLTLVNQ